MAFSFSYSKIKSFDTCPRRHYEVDLKKNFKDSGVAMKWGLEVHEALALACRQRSNGGVGKLPETMVQWQHWVDRYADPSLPGTLLAEQKYTITKDFQPTEWNDWNRAWYRGVVDLLRIDGPVARAVDWKTGKIQHDSRQLMLNAQTIFVYHPQVQRIYTEFVWLKDDAVTPEVFNRATIAREWPPVFEKLKLMEEAARLNNYPANRSGLCFKNCPVRSCAFFQKRPNETVTVGGEE